MTIHSKKTLADLKKEQRTQQMTYGLGCVPSQIDGTEHELTPDEKAVLPEVFDFRRTMPPVRNQGMTFTCVCQSLTGCLDYIVNARNNVANKCNGFDINELYSSRANKYADGMTFKEALHYLKHNGLNGEKINSYSKLPSVFAVKYALVMFGPVVCGFPVYTSSSKFWRKPGRFQGGHAVTIVGYNEEGFIIRNSWGTGWANNGHTVISYDEYQESCFESWVITL